jgi:hypothetical protein
MQDKGVYKRFLEIESPWAITDVQLDDSKMTVSVAIEFRDEPCCSKCDKSCAGYDSRVRTWRY